MSIPLPSAQTPLVDDSKLVTTAWFRYFADQSQQTTTDIVTLQEGAVTDQIVAPLNLSYTAPGIGAFLVVPGTATISQMTYTRARKSLTLSVPTASTFIPAGSGDTLGFTISSVGGTLAVHFIPSGA